MNPIPYRKIAGISLFVLGAIALVWFIFIRPDAALKSAATAEANRTVAEAQQQAAEETVKIIVEHGETVTAINHRTEVTNDEIQRTPGAIQEIDPALHAAGLRALCLHNGRSEPSCALLLHGDGSGQRVGEADTARAPSE